LTYSVKVNFIALTNVVNTKIVMMESYDTLVEAINGLREQGYTEDFNLLQDCVECKARNFKIFHDEFTIDKFFRFEGYSDPADSSIIYAVHSEKYNLKGIMINGYGIYSDDITDKMLRKLK